MSDTLFRREVMDAQGSSRDGTIVLVRPIPMRLAAIAAFVVTAILILFSLKAEYTRKVHVGGQIVPASGAIKVVTPQFGRVTGRSVEEGDVVQAGQLLFEISSDRDSENGDVDSRIKESIGTRRELLNQERNVQVQQLQQHAVALQKRQEIVKAELIRLGEEISLQQRRVDSAALNLNRYRSLREKGFVSDMQLVQIENDSTEQLARKQSLERAKLAATAEVLQAQEEADQVNGQVRLITTQLDRSLASLDQESAEQQGRSHARILAPTSGTVTAILAEPGQSIAPGASLATIIPSDGALQAQLQVPSRAIGFVEPGQRVLLRLAAFPYQKFGPMEGVVLRVEHSPVSDISTGNLAAAEAFGMDSTYRVAVKLSSNSVFAYGRNQQIRSGMALEADIRQDRRKLIDWFFDPITSIGKLTD